MSLSLAKNKNANNQPLLHQEVMGISINLYKLKRIKGITVVDMVFTSVYTFFYWFLFVSM